MTECPARDRMFELHVQNFERNRMYPPGYRKESPMLETDSTVQTLRKLSKECPPTILELPRNPVGLPEGSFILDNFLDYIADCLIGKSNPTANYSKPDSESWVPPLSPS